MAASGSSCLKCHWVFRNIWIRFVCSEKLSSDSLGFGNLSSRSPPAHMQLIGFIIFITPCSFCCSLLCQQPDRCQGLPSERSAPHPALVAGGRRQELGEHPFAKLLLATQHSYQSVLISEQPFPEHSIHVWQGKTCREKDVPQVPGSVPTVKTSFLLRGTVQSHSKGVLHFLYIRSCLLLGSWAQLLNELWS